MPKPTHFPSGVSNCLPWDPLYEMGQLDPAKWHTYFNDFDTYVAGDWTVTRIGTTPTEAVGTVDGGMLVLTVSAADNDGDNLQLKSFGFKPEAGRKMFFKCRFKVSDATQSDLLIGLASSDTTLLGAVDGTGVTDGIFFTKEDGDALLDVELQKNATTGQTRAAAIATIADDTFLTVAWYYDGKSELAYFVNDVQKGHLDASSTYLPDTDLGISFAILNGEAVAKILTIDYVFAAKERLLTYPLSQGG